jgi:topoisomerase-4 subunit B
MATTRKTVYNEASFRALKGLEPVRQNPGMYTHVVHPLHIIQEAIDNAVDEALAGFGKRIVVTLYRDGSVEVADEGRGIPVGVHPEEGKHVVEMAFTMLHAGGKFNKEGNDAAYVIAGGLHGVGVAVTNALSKRLEVTVFREGAKHFMAFQDGEVAQKLTSTRGKEFERRSGTAVRAWPDPKYFDSPSIPQAELEHLVRSKAYLLPGLTALLRIEGREGFDERSWTYKGGMAQYFDAMLGGRELAAPLFTGERFFEQDPNEQSAEIMPGEGAAWAVGFVADGDTFAESHVNLIPTRSGGTHELGFRNGLFDALRAFMDTRGVMPKGVKLVADRPRKS